MTMTIEHVHRIVQMGDFHYRAICRCGYRSMWWETKEEAEEALVHHLHRERRKQRSRLSKATMEERMSMQGGRWWTRLSDGELRARLEQRGLPAEEVYFLVKHRDDVPQSIYDVLGDE